MRKKAIILICVVLVAMLALFAFTACDAQKGEYGRELVTNGDFSRFDETAKKFEGWSVPSSVTGVYGRGVKSASDTESQDPYLYFQNSRALYTYAYQRIEVVPHAIYKVTFDVRIWGDSETNNPDLNDDYGAHIEFLENDAIRFGSSTKATNAQTGDAGGFVTHTFYVRPQNTDYLTLALCIGSTEAGCTGNVDFDNISMQRVAKADVPEGAQIYSFRKVRTYANSTTGSGITFVVMLTLTSVALLFAAYIVIKRIYASKNAFQNIGSHFSSYATKSSTAIRSGKWYHNSAVIAIAVLLVTFLVRLVILLTMYGMGANMTSTLNAATALGLKDGVRTYLQNNPTSTYSPGTMYILAIIGAASGKLSLRSASILMRFVNVLADMAVVLMIYSYGQKKVGNRLSTVYALLYALMPFTFIMGGINASFESVTLALLLAAVLLMVNKQYLATYGVMALATVMDVRALAIAPIIVAYFVYMYIKDNANIKKFTSNRAQIVFGLIASVVAVYLLTLPVGINQIAAGDAFFNFKVIANEMSGVTYFVSNAFNLYGMVAMNNRTMGQVGQTNAVSILNFIFLLVLEAYAISLYFKNRNRQELILLTSFVLSVIAVFTVKVNYTYLLLALAFAYVYTMISGDRRMYLITAGYSVLGFLGIGQMLNQSGFVASLNTTGALVNFETTNAYYIVFCVFAVLLTAYYVYVCYSITNNSKISDIKAMPEPFFTTVKKGFKNFRLNFKKSSEK